MRRRLDICQRSALILAAVVFFGAQARAEDARTPVWRFAVPAGVEWVERREDLGALLICDRSARVTAVRLADGAERGQFAGKSGIASAGGDRGQSLLFDRYVVQLIDWTDAQSGPRKIWSRGEWPPTDAEDDDPEFLTANVAAAITRDAVYVFRSDGKLGRLQRSDGTPLDVREIGKLVDARLMADGENVLLTGRREGDTIVLHWKDPEGPSVAKPVKLGSPLWVGIQGPSIVSVGRDAVRVLVGDSDKTINLPKEFHAAASAVAIGIDSAKHPILLLGGAGGGLLAVDAFAGSVRWRSDRPATASTNIFIDADHAVVAGANACDAFTLTDGRVLAHLEGAGECRAASVRGNTLFAAFAKAGDDIRTTITLRWQSASSSRPDTTGVANAPSITLGAFEGLREVIFTPERLLIVDKAAVTAFAWPAAESKS